jgi:hypothetical protein
MNLLLASIDLFGFRGNLMTIHFGLLSLQVLSYGK